MLLTQSNVKIARVLAGYSQQELARRAGIDRADLSRVETGATKPSATVRGRISAALGVSCSRLWPELDS
jgi:transcriptional regulator with XRE-family HTH domain